MSFQNEKKVFLSKTDKSKKGSIDKRIRKLVDAINRKGYYYTTSSCSGRIVLLKAAEHNKKNESRWLFSTHEKARFKDLKESLARPPKENVWFKSEGMILHVCCSTIDDAVKLLDAARSAGLKHSGICSISKKDKIIVEIIDSEHFDLPVSKRGRLLVSDAYLKHIVEEANEKLGRTWKRIDKLEKIMKGI